MEALVNIFGHLLLHLMKSAVIQFIIALAPMFTQQVVPPVHLVLWGMIISVILGVSIIFGMAICMMTTLCGMEPAVDLPTPAAL